MEKRSRNWKGRPLRPCTKRTDIHHLLAGLGPVVYAIRTRDGLVKIGYTANLSQRVTGIGGGFKAILGWMPGTFEDEQAIHASLNGQAVRGREWYPPTPEVLAVVNDMRSHLGQDPIAA